MISRFALLCLLALGPAQAGEHPHLLFNTEDLPRLRAAAETGVGQRWIQGVRNQLQIARSAGFAFHGETAEAMMTPTWAAGEGLIYLLSGDGDHARQAMAWTWSGMYGSLANKNQWRQAYRVAHIAVAYDFCASAWPEDFRNNVYHFLLRQVDLYTGSPEAPDRLNTGNRYQYESETLSRNRGPGHAEHRRYLAAAGLAALAIRQDPPPVFTPVPDDKALDIPPAEDLLLIPGVPVVTLSDGQMFSSWLANGPFPASDPDPLHSIGGLSGARPLPGTRVDSMGESLDFRPYKHDHWNPEDGPTFYPRDCMRYFTQSTGNGFPPGKRILARLRETEGATAGIALVWYTLWKVESALVVRAYPNLYWSSRGVRMWVNGRPVLDDQVLRLRPGLYPVTVHLPVTGGYAQQAPHFRVLTPEIQAAEASGAVAARAALAENPDFLQNKLNEIEKELTRFVAEEMASDGSETLGLSDHLPLFARAVHQATGRNPFQGTGLDKTPVMAALWRDMPGGDERLRMALNLLPGLEGEEARIGTWLLYHSDPPLHRPTDALLPLLALASGQLPEAEHPTPFLFQEEGAGARLLRTDNGYLFGMMGGTASERPLSLILAQGPSDIPPVYWLNAGEHARNSEDWASVPRIQDRPSPEPAESLRSERLPGELLALTLRVPGIERSLWGEFSGKDPLILIADTFQDVGRDEEKSVQVYLDGNLPATTWLPLEGRLVHTRHKRHLVMRVFSPRPLTLERHAHNIEATRGIVRFVMDKQTAPDQRHLDDDRRMLLSGEIPDLALEFEEELKLKQKKAERETLTLITVIQLGENKDALSDVTWNPPELRVGHRLFILGHTGWETTSKVESRTPTEP